MVYAFVKQLRTLPTYRTNVVSCLLSFACALQLHHPGLGGGVGYFCLLPLASSGVASEQISQILCKLELMNVLSISDFHLLEKVLGTLE